MSNPNNQESAAAELLYAKVKAGLRKTPGKTVCEAESEADPQDPTDLTPKAISEAAQRKIVYEAKLADPQDPTDLTQDHSRPKAYIQELLRRRENNIDVKSDPTIPDRKSSSFFSIMLQDCLGEERTVPAAALWNLSVRYDHGKEVSHFESTGVYSKRAQILYYCLGPNRAYNPNRVQKKTRCIKRCINSTDPSQVCRTYATGEKPDDSHCWRASYLWHLQQSRKMIQLVDGDGVLGAGQVWEETMARALNCKILRLWQPRKPEWMKYIEPRYYATTLHYSYGDPGYQVEHVFDKCNIILWIRLLHQPNVRMTLGLSDTDLSAIRRKAEKNSLFTDVDWEILLQGLEAEVASSRPVEIMLETGVRARGGPYPYDLEGLMSTGMFKTMPLY